MRTTHKYNQQPKIPLKIRLEAFLYRKVPSYYWMQKSAVRARTIVGRYLLFAIIVTGSLVSIYLFMHGYMRSMPPTEATAKQNNLMNMTALLLFVFVYSLGLKLYKTPVPRGNIMYRG